MFERMTEPDRVIQFRVTWQDDDGDIQVNRAWRVQSNNAIGPYKGGLRFHENVNLGVLKDVLFGPGKAANAGGVAVSGLEQSQNAQRISWSREEVCDRLGDIMKGVHERCVEHGGDGDRINYAKGATIAGFRRIADALVAYGAV